MSKNVNINGKTYVYDELSNEAKQLVANYGIAEAKLGQLAAETAMITLARDTYAKALGALMERTDKAAAKAKVDKAVDAPATAQ